MARKLFGTDGVRGVAGEFLGAELSLALARTATARLGTSAPRVLVIRDTRESGEMIEAAVAAGVAAAGGEAPHVAVAVFARGLLDRVPTRIYFGDEHRANAADPLLSSLDPERTATLIAAAEDGGYRFDIHLQGDHETTFFGF